jgi:hypothetical protein
MKGRKIALLIMMLVPICSFSQHISNPTLIDTIHLSIPVNEGELVTITDKQLKTANLIFLEHEKLSKEVPLLNEKISNLEKINSIWQHTDSIRKSNELKYIKTINNNDSKIKQLKKDKNILLGTSFTSIALFLLSLFL